MTIIQRLKLYSLPKSAQIQYRYLKIFTAGEKIFLGIDHRPPLHRLSIIQWGLSRLWGYV